MFTKWWWSTEQAVDLRTIGRARNTALPDLTTKFLDAPALICNAKAKVIAVHKVQT
jgi:hypothetical protein